MFKLTLVTPERKIVIDQELEEVTLPGHNGELDVLPGHSPLMTTLGAGILKYKLKNGESQKMAISWGYCQVSPEGVNVLAEFASTALDIKPEDAQKRLSQIESRLLNESLSDEDFQSLQEDKGRILAELDLLSHK